MICSCVGCDMSHDDKQIEEELSKIKVWISEIKELANKSADSKGSESDVIDIVKFMMDEREKTINSALGGIARRVQQIEVMVREDHASKELTQVNKEKRYEELPLSNLDRSIVEFVQQRQDGLACADDIRDFMRYKGRNAACARLKRLEQQGLLKSVRLGHKVYYRFDAGKATTLIISPPQ